MVFLPLASSSEAKEPESDCDSSSTVGGRSECWETLGVITLTSLADGEATEATLGLALLGKGGLFTTTGEEAEATGLLLMPISETEEVSKSDVALAAAVAAAAAILEPASWLRDLTIMRPFGPTLGEIFLAIGNGGVPVTLAVPDEW